MGYKDPDRQKAYQSRWCVQRRADSLAGRACEGCGSSENLEWHHLDPAEKITHAIWSWSPERAAKELEKCIPLCVPCHKAVTARSRRAEAIARNPHGTQNRYHLGCRCDPCREAHKAYNAAHPRKALA